MAVTEVRAVVEGYLAALSAADVELVLAHVTDDFHNEHTSALGSSCHGSDAYRSRLPGFLGSFPGLHYDVVETLVEGDRAAVRYRMTATVDGRGVDLPGVMLFEVRDGRIARRTDVWDSLSFLRQTGAAPDT